MPRMIFWEFEHESKVNTARTAHKNHLLNFETLLSSNFLRMRKRIPNAVKNTDSPMSARLLGKKKKDVRIKGEIENSAVLVILNGVREYFALSF